ncbi:MAG: dihydrofolate reductase family protein [Thermoplasmata archaeon]|nr:dihydrofolate reductase family protein [Thermoplasmata archaeon]
MVPPGEDRRRPWIVLNFAMSADGKLALADCTPVDISSPEDMIRVHRLRAIVRRHLGGRGDGDSGRPQAPRER